jgi:hypothetical protein
MTSEDLKTFDRDATLFVVCCVIAGAVLKLLMVLFG